MKQAIKVQMSRSALLRLQRGVSLIELMVGMVLGLIVIGGILNVFLVNRESIRMSENLAVMQDNTRMGFEMLTRDIREAGENPCGARMVANVVRTGGSGSTIPWWADWNLGSLRGWDNTQDSTAIKGFGTAANDRASGTDALLVMQSEPDVQVVTAHDPGTATFTLRAVTGLGNLDVLLACNPSRAAVFQAITVTGGGANTVTHSQNNLNCSTLLGFPTPTNCTTPTTYTFPAGVSMVSKLRATFWYVGMNADGTRSLKRTRLLVKTIGGVQQATWEPEDMIPNVQDMQIKYLTSNGTTLGAGWLDASNTTVINGDWSTANTNGQPVAVRLELTMRSKENFDGSAMERKLIQVVALRNRDNLLP